MSYTSILDEKKMILRALQRKRDSLAVEIATRLDLPRRWVMADVDLDDPRIVDLKEKLLSTERKIYHTEDEVEFLEAKRDGEIDRYNARKIAYDWLHLLGDEGNQWLIDHKLTTVTLTEEILKNPNFLEEVIV